MTKLLLRKHCFTLKNALKLTYGKVEFKKFPGGNTPDPRAKGRRGEEGGGRREKEGSGGDYPLALGKFIPP